MEDDHLNIVMEYAENGDLYKVLDKINMAVIEATKGKEEVLLRERSLDVQL